jgi:hypothetical protein
MSRARSVLVTAAVLALAGCGGSGVRSEASERTPTTSAPFETIAVDPITSTTPDTSTTPETSTTTPSTTSNSSTTVELNETTTTLPAPVDELQELLGTTPIDLDVSGGDPGRPVFSWDAAGGSRFELVVRTPDGAPLWAWTGTTTNVVLGGVERPAGAEGPTLLGPAQARVVAFDGAGAPLAASPWVAVGPPAA